MWDLERIEARIAALEAGITEMQEQYKQAILVQRGAIGQLQEIRQEMVDAQTDGAEKKRERRANKRAHINGNGAVPEPIQEPESMI